MNARRVSAAAGVVLAAQKQRQTPAGIAAALEAAGLLQSPESAAELVALREQAAGPAPMAPDREQEIRADLAAIPAPPWRWIGLRGGGGPQLVTDHSGRQYLLRAAKPTDHRGDELLDPETDAVVYGDLEFRDQRRGETYSLMRSGNSLAVGRTEYDPDAIVGVANPLARWFEKSAQHATELLAEVDRLRADRAQLQDDITGACLARHEEEQENERLRARVAELEAQRDRRRARLVALQNDALNMRGSLSPNGEARKVPFELGETLTPAVDWLINRVAELEAARTTAAADRDKQIIEWLEKKGREEGTSNKDSRVRATMAYRLADKLSRDAVRPACPPVSPEDPHDSPLHHSYAVGRDLPEVTPEPPAVTVDRWNAQYPVGTPVTAHPGFRPETDPKGTQLTTRTRSAASVLGGHTAVVWVEGHSSCIKLTHVYPRHETGGAL